MQRIKRTVSLALDITTEELNEISLEDIEIDQASKRRIYKALYDMTLISDMVSDTLENEVPNSGVPCTGFWVEGTKELILFAWCQHRSETIVIPSEEWFLRDDITVH